MLRTVLSAFAFTAIVACGAAVAQTQQGATQAPPAERAVSPQQAPAAPQSAAQPQPQQEDEIKFFDRSRLPRCPGDPRCPPLDTRRSDGPVPTSGQANTGAASDTPPPN